MADLQRYWRRVEPWPSGQADPLEGLEDCACLHPGLRFPAIERELGMDPQTYAEVVLRRCALCDRFWLQVLIEHEAFSRSGRWHRAVLGDHHRRVALGADMAVAVLGEVSWHISGGSWFEGQSRICRPPISISVAPASDDCRPLYFERK